MDRLIDSLMKWVVRVNVATLTHLIPTCMVAYLLQQAGMSPQAGFIVAALSVAGAASLFTLYRR